MSPSRDGLNLHQMLVPAAKGTRICSKLIFGQALHDRVQLRVRNFVGNPTRFSKAVVDGYWQHGPGSADTGSVWLDDCYACRIAAASAPVAGPELSSVRRSARIVRRAELLECRLEPALHRGRRDWSRANSSRCNNFRALRRNFLNRLWLVVLPS